MKKIEANLTNKADWKTPFREVRGLAFSPKDAWRENDLVCIEDDFEYQTIRGFGAAITEAAAILIISFSSNLKALLRIDKSIKSSLT